MYRTAGLILLVLSMAVLFPAHLVQAEAVANPDCCPCPEPAGGAGPPNAADAPVEITLESIAGVYGPVEFTHEEHTDYAEDGCVTCHHHQAAGEKIKPCVACHKRELFPGDPERLNVPGLQGAYHRQCVGCHVDAGSGPTECADCHQIEVPGSGAE